MLISELIAQLEAVKAEHGDRLVATKAGDDVEFSIDKAIEFPNDTQYLNRGKAALEVDVSGDEIVFTLELISRFEAYNVDYYTRVTEWGDNIQGMAEAHGLTLEDALDEGVYSPDDGGEECVFVPLDVARDLSGA